MTARLWTMAMLAIALVLLWRLPGAQAHTRSESFSSWSASGHQVIGIFQVEQHRVTQLAEQPTDLDALTRLLARHLAGHVSVRQNGAACAATEPRALTAEAGRLRMELTYTCPVEIAEKSAEIEVLAFRPGSPGHVHYVRIGHPDGRVHEAVVAGAQTAVEIGGPVKVPHEHFSAFVHIGLEHVLSGLDHMAFLLALMLLAARPSHAALAATGFTLGHSVTLALVAFGWLRPHTAAIEALIGFTIAYTAFLASARRTPGTGSAQRGLARALVLASAIVALPVLARLGGLSTPPWMIYAGAGVFAACFGGRGETDASGPGTAVVLAMAFGLVHGAGFAGGLLELDLPKDRLLMALLGFNIGVELAQVTLLAACAVVAASARYVPRGWPVVAREVTAAALVGLGVYWFVARSIA